MEYLRRFQVEAEHRHRRKLQRESPFSRRSVNADHRRDELRGRNSTQTSNGIRRQYSTFKPVIELRGKICSISGTHWEALPTSRPSKQSACNGSERRPEVWGSPLEKALLGKASDVQDISCLRFRGTSLLSSQFRPLYLAWFLDADVSGVEGAATLSAQMRRV